LPRYRFFFAAISIFSSPHSDINFFFALRQKSIYIRLTAIHASWGYQFFFASWQKLISFRLTGIHTSRRYQFFLCLMAKIDFFLPDGNSRLTGISIFSLHHGEN
jgi:hypothetical protein